MVGSVTRRNSVGEKNANGQRPRPTYNYFSLRMQSLGNDQNNTLIGTQHGEGQNDVAEFTCLMSRIRSSNDSGTGSLSRSWIVDSGCISHMTHDGSMFVSYKSMSGCFVEMGTAAKAEIVGIGGILLRTRVHRKDTYFKLEKVCYIPTYKYSLLSVRVFYQKGLLTSFKGKRCTVSSGSKDVFQAQLQGSLYILNAESIPSKECEMVLIAATLDTWHRRLAHVNSDGILRMLRKGVVRGIKLSNNSMKSLCGDCVIGKAHRCNILKMRSSPRSAICWISCILMFVVLWRCHRLEDLCIL